MSSALEKLAKRAVPMASEGMREVEIPLDKIRFDPTQPRQAFHHPDGQIAEKDEEYIAELATAIDSQGLIQAITVQEMGDGTYLVVVGECRTRAHLLIGKPTIRAVIRNDLTNPATRLIFQLAENVNRQDLTDAELAASIRELMKGGEGVEPMTQAQIADKLGKSEGWVSRFVKFGDEELQRLWVKTGIADTVEKVYRLSILPQYVQVEIKRRVALPKRDPEHLAKPLNRNVIDELAKEAKAGKRVSSPNLGQTSGANSKHEPGALLARGEQGTGSGGSFGLQDDDEVGKALAGHAAAGRQVGQGGGQGTAPPASTSAKYQLPEDARTKILGNLPPEPDAGSRSRDLLQPPVNCRVAVGNVTALLNLLESNAEMRNAVDDVQCSLNIPGPLAQLIANTLTGMVVDAKEVPATVQMELSKLQ